MEGHAPGGRKTNTTNQELCIQRNEDISRHPETELPGRGHADRKCINVGEHRQTLQSSTERRSTDKGGLGVVFTKVSVKANFISPLFTDLKALPSAFGCHTANKCRFCGLDGTTFFPFECLLLVFFILKGSPALC